VDLGVEIRVKAEELYSIRERGDRLIAATAAVLALPLVTRDPEIDDDDDALTLFRVLPSGEEG
jgi:predicted nucleic acid-binding protein